MAAGVEETGYADAHLDRRRGHCSGDRSIVCEVEKDVPGLKFWRRDALCESWQHGDRGRAHERTDRGGQLQDRDEGSLFTGLHDLYRNKRMSIFLRE